MTLARPTIQIDARSCLVLGSASCVWEDVERALSVGEYDHVIAVKAIGERWGGKLLAWVTLHPEMLAASVRARRAAGHSMQFDTWSSRASGRHGNPGIKVDYVTTDWAGSSGLLGVKVALEGYGFKRVVCAGMPLTKTPHFNKPNEWVYALGYHRGWRRRYDDLKPYVRSMSGWTRDLLGEPTEEWLNG